MKLAVLTELAKRAQAGGDTSPKPAPSVLSFASTARLEKFRRKALRLQKIRKLEKEKDNILEEAQKLPKIYDDKGVDVTPRSLLAREDISKGYVLKASRTFVAGSCVDVLRGSNTVRELDVFETVPSKSIDLRYVSSKTRLLRPLPPVVSSMDSKGYIILKETDTEWIYDIPPTSIIESQEEFDKVIQKNEDYKKYLLRHKDGEAVSNVITQTIILPKKSKGQQTQPTSHKIFEATASEVLIHDAYMDLSKEDSAKKIDNKNLVSTQVLATEELSPDNTYLLSKSSLLQKLVILERAVNCATYRNVIDKFKEVCFPHKDILPVIKVPTTPQEKETEKEEPVEEEKQAIILEKLLVLKCRFIDDYSVTSMSWNKENSDLLAVGYKYKILPATSRGLVCGWNVKNCKAPERVFETHYGVTCVRFCEAAAYLLAVGMHEGGLAIYDVRTARSNAIAHNFKSSYRPVGTVWDLQWTAKDTGHKGIKHLITSVSEDGSIIQWTLQNVLEGLVLMRLRNASSVSVKEKRFISSYLSQYASGYSIQCSSLDKNIYLVSTSDGNIYKCSTLYSERHLMNYDLHYGPVFCVQYCPLSPDKFLSCGNDGTIAFWSDNDNVPHMVVKASQRYCAIIDAAWSFTSPNVFAVISLSYLEAWNTNLSLLEPIATAKIAVDKHLTCVTFCPTGDVIAVGDSNGIVVFYILHNPANLIRE